VARRHHLEDFFPVRIMDGDCYRILWPENIASGGFIAETFAIVVKLQMPLPGARVAISHSGMRANLDVAAGPQTQLYAGTVAGGSAESTAGPHKVQISFSLSLPTNLVKDVSYHFLITREIAGAERHGFPGLKANVFPVCFFCNNAGYGTGTIDIAYLGVVLEKPFGAVSHGLLMVDLHHLSPSEGICVISHLPEYSGPMIELPS
jgi:hypothetical protein